MPSHSRIFNHLHLSIPLHLSRNKHQSLPPTTSLACSSRSLFGCATLQLHPLIIQQYECGALRNVVPTRAFDDDSFDIPMFDDWNAADESSAYVFSSSDGEDYDGEVFLTPVNDIDLPSVSASNDDAVTVAAHRFATLGRGQKKPRTKLGIFITMGLIIVLTLLLLYVDWCAWRIVRLPLSPFYLTRPFLISAFLVSFAGYVGIPIFRLFKFIHVIKQQGPASHRTKKLTPTLGGLLFVPIGIIVAHVFASSSSTEVSGAAGATIAFAAVGLLSDILSLTNHRRVLPVLTEVLLQVAVGTWFSFWLDITSISSPYGMKHNMLVPLPLGLVYLGRCYQLLTSFSFVSMGHGVKLADAIDGLAGGTAALAFTGMSIAVLPVCSDLAIFGASMAGSCVGFLLHNRYKASIFMGHTGSLALGGGLAAMASCTGMFFPLLISSGIFVVESLSVIIQLLYLKITKSFRGAGWRLLRIPPFHYRLQLRGFREPNIVLGAYLISSILALLGGYVGLVSA
ncbi:Phospho-N-acetylmuramoyl-pentapeptide-transferase-like protein [Vigna angularis]|uniref:Phospho-N-acetylmuramoyl-pentapeptide-transferase-like protein n=1 Tax=Phaseolus angularis TaxID=3914 RepID=A0A8T0KBE7_PHAAN|nr:Phospho-N-acetylmuramoyl-pentapeptide-transferase-like protein [Vigna angularis]